MEITLENNASLRLATKSTSLVVATEPGVKADVFLGLHSQPAVSGYERWFAGPGEYEVRGVMVDGVQTGEGLTSYHVSSEGVMLAAVSLKAPADLTDSVLEHLQPSAALALWVEEGTAQELAELIARFEVQRIFALHLPCELVELEKALQLTAEKVEKLRLTTKELADGSRKLIQLEA